MSTSINPRLATLTLLACLLFPVSARQSVLVQAADEADAAADETEPAAGASDKDSEESQEKELALEIGQQALLSQFDRFEKELVQMAEQLRRADPERAGLLFRTHSKSQQERVVGQMRVIQELLANDPPQFGDSIQRQEALVKSLVTLLDLLQSENRMGEIEAERERVRDILKNVNRLIGKEKDARAATERGADLKRAADEQESVENDAEKLIDKVQEQDAQKQADRESEGRGQKKADSDSESDSESSEEKDASGKDGSEKSGGKDSDSEGQSKSKDGDSKSKKSESGDSQKGKPQEGDSQKSQQQEGQPSQQNPSGQKQGQQKQGQSGQQQPQQQTPGRKDLEQARDEMQKAIEKLEKERDRNKASRHQDEAIRKLLEAKEKLEEILRQLREEEKSLMLASLESRFRKMLGMQLQVYQDTVRIDSETEPNDPNRLARGRQLATREEELVREVDKALIVLREEGSSVAFPHAVEAIREDASSIVRLLDEGKTGELTQTIEQGVIEAIEEMVDALQKEMEKNKKDSQQRQGQPQQGGQQEQPLVDALSELKMLRSLQLRINRRTRRLGRMIEGEQPDQPELLKQLKTLSRRQAKIQEATYDLSTGRNQ